MNEFILRGIVVVLAVAGTLKIGWDFGADYVQSEFDTYKLALVKENETALIANQAKLRQAQIDNDTISRKVAEDHESKVSELNKKIADSDARIKRAGGLRVPASICGQPGVPTTPTGNGEHEAYIAGTRELPQEVGDALKRLADDADQVVEFEREHQSWERSHGF